VSELTDSSGNVVESYKYDSFGNMETPPTTENFYTYTGREYDSETGLYFYRARYYNSRVGRFLSEDPIGFNGGVNFYSYGKNNPIIFIDPHGLWCIPWFSYTTPWELRAGPFIKYTVNAVFSDMTGVIGTCYWKKISETEKIRDVTEREYCCEYKCKNWKCEIRNKRTYQQREWFEDEVDRKATPAVQWNNDWDPETADTWGCVNPWTGKAIYAGHND
jgi:RHS repeat-associated protein